MNWKCNWIFHLMAPKQRKNQMLSSKPGCNFAPYRLQKQGRRNLREWGHELPQYKTPNQLHRKKFGKDCFRTEHFTTNLAREVFCPQSRAKNVRTWKNFELPQYGNPKKLYGKKIGKDCFRTEHFRTNLVRDVFCPQSRAKNVRTWKNFELPQYRNPIKLHGKNFW